MAGGPRPGNRLRAGFFIALLAAGSVRATDPAPESSLPSSPALPEVLSGLERASRLYLDSALKFACQETIVERSETRRQSHRFEYLFVRDINGALQDYRVVRARKGQEPVRTEPSEVGVRRYLERAYMWVLIFKKDRQPLHRYRLEAMEELNGAPAIRIGFEPLPPYEEGINDWFGTSWVDPRTFQILKVEAMRPERHEAWLRFQADMEALRTGDFTAASEGYRLERVTTEFSVVKNGMRFPGRVKIVNSLYFLPRDGHLRRAVKTQEEKTEQSYTNYAFYAVRTTEEVNRMLGVESKKRRP